MSPRLAGAALALIAAALLAMSIVTSAWWAGHPEVEGRTIDAKTVHVGLHGAEGCNTGGDLSCTSLDLPGAFTATGFAEAGVSSLLVIAALLLAITTLRMTEGRKVMSSVVFVLVGLAVLIAIALIVQGPKVKASQHVAIPMGYGMALFAVGAIAAALSGVLARRPAPKMELRPSRSPVVQPPVDVLAMMQQEEPRRPSAPIASTPLPGPAGPLGASQSQPMFHAPPQMPVQPPRPVTTQGAAAVPLTSPRPKPPTFAPPPPPAFVPPAPPAFVPPPPPPRSNPPSVPPPPRWSPPSVPPPVANPPTLRGRPGTVPPPGAIAARLKASSVPPPVRPASVAAPPAPTTPKTLAGIPAPPIVAAKLPVRAETDPGDHLETVERERETVDVGDATDASLSPAPGADVEDTGVSAPLDTEEAPVVRPETSSDDLETAAREKMEPEAVAPVAPEPAVPNIPITTAPSTLPPPKDKQVATSGPSPACPQCEAPMAWVEEHLRFYCKSCRMYF